MSRTTFDEKDENTTTTTTTSLRAYSKTSIKEANKQLELMHNKIIQLKDLNAYEKRENHARVCKMHQMLKKKDAELDDLRKSNKNWINAHDSMEKSIREKEAKLAELLNEKNALAFKLNRIKTITSETS